MWELGRWHINTDGRVWLWHGKHTVCCSSRRGHMISIRTKANVVSSWMRAQAGAGMWLGMVLESITSRDGTGGEGWQLSLNCSFNLCPFIVSQNTSLTWFGCWGCCRTRETRMRLQSKGNKSEVLSKTVWVYFDEGNTRIYLRLRPAQPVLKIGALILVLKLNWSSNIYLYTCTHHVSVINLWFECQDSKIPPTCYIYIDSSWQVESNGIIKKGVHASYKDFWCCQ